MSANRIPDASTLTTWRKSSYSGGSGGDCVEVADGYTEAVWRKSSHSGPDNGDCVEVADNYTLAAWHKSSHSGGSGGSCVEVADGIRTVVPVRDSKKPQGPALVFSPEAWTAFVAGVKAGDFAAD